MTALVAVIIVGTVLVFVITNNPSLERHQCSHFLLFICQRCDHLLAFHIVVANFHGALFAVEFDPCRIIAFAAAIGPFEKSESVAILLKFTGERKDHFAAIESR